MKNSNNPSEKQVTLLQNYGIKPPKNRKACHRLIAYICHGNGTIGDNPNERIAIVKSYENKWLGKKVQAIWGIGTIQFLWAKYADEIAYEKKMNQADFRHCFYFYIKYDESPKGKPSIISPATCTIIE